MRACVRACVLRWVASDLEPAACVSLLPPARAHTHTHTHAQARTRGGWLICGSLSSAPVQLTSSLTEESHASPPLSTRPGFTRQGESRHRSGTRRKKVSELVFTANILSVRGRRGLKRAIKQRPTEMKPGSFCLTERTRICLAYVWLFLRSGWMISQRRFSGCVGRVYTSVTPIAGKRMKVFELS